MKKNIKKFLALILSLICLSCMCTTAFAAETKSVDEDISTYATLKYATGVNTSSTSESVDITLYETCNSVRIWGRYFNGSVQNVLVTIIYPSGHNYSFYATLNSNYTSYVNLPKAATPGTYTIQFVQAGAASSYEAAIYFYN